MSTKPQFHNRRAVTDHKKRPSPWRSVSKVAIADASERPGRWKA